MKQKNTVKRKTNSAAAKRINVWLAILAGIIAVGGVFAFGLIAYIANAAGESSDTYNPLWMVYMIPVMGVIAVPVTILIAKFVYKHFNALSDAINAVANGQTGVHIPTAGAGAFAGIYSDFNKMADEIAGMQRLRTEIVDGFSHELKTPVASISGFARLLLDEELPEDKRRKYLEIIVSESERLARLSQDNLTLSKIDAQEIIHDRQPYNIGRQIQEIAIAMETAWSDKNINLSAELADVIYNGNANLMESLWQNLLSNAIKFTPKNGDIHIALADAEDCVIITFADTGIGMSKEVRAHVFERYYQGDTSHTGEGHGLGLSIAARIVKLCGGTITVESSIGEGSTFTVTLPK
ncbi:MAG: HAMP domain-containing histidine kinase [Firmicutes bacterium]|nr:HAMP domain-containing histidine kinase [Bacillota bacterium]